MKIEFLDRDRDPRAKMLRDLPELSLPRGTRFPVIQIERTWVNVDGVEVPGIRIIAFETREVG